MSSEYHFKTHWRIEGRQDEVFGIIDDVGTLTQWWPSVYLEVKVVDPGDEAGIGKVAQLLTKGWLPYTLNWQLQIVEKVPNQRIVLIAAGDFEGRGEWTFTPQGLDVDVHFDWRISAEKPLLKYLSFAMRPVFSWNHQWAMARGLESLRLEIARRRAGSDEERAAIAVPPAPTFRRQR